MARSSWWDRHCPSRLQEFLGWVGDRSAASKVYVRRHVKQKEYKSIVDVGCGPGTEYSGYRHDGYRIDWLGVDSCEYLLKHCRNVEKAPVVFGYAEELPLPDRCREVVYLRHVLEHLVSFEEALREAIRVATKEVIVVWFLPPGDKCALSYDSSEKLFHNRYEKACVERFVALQPRVTGFWWRNVETESVLHIELGAT